jgi:hypothetical protein
MNCTLQISTKSGFQYLHLPEPSLRTPRIVHRIAQGWRTSVLCAESRHLTAERAPPSPAATPLRDAYPSSLKACLSCVSQFVRRGRCIPLRAANPHEAYTRRSRRSESRICDARTPHIIVMSCLLNDHLNLHLHLCFTRWFTRCLTDSFHIYDIGAQDALGFRSVAMPGSLICERPLIR